MPLLNLTAPTIDFLSLAPFQQAVVDDIHRTFTPAQLVSYAYPGVRVEPIWYYSNTNYILAEIIIERATGMSYADALNKMLLEPLHLHETYYEPRVPPKAVLDAMASGYNDHSYCGELADPLPPPCAQQPLDDLLGRDLKTTSLSAFGASGGIVASLPDVTSWARALFSDQLLPPQQQTELFSLVSEASGQPIAAASAAEPGYGLGISQIWSPETGGPIWFYGGETFGYRVMWACLPGDDLVVSIGVNSAHPGDAFALSQAVLGILEPNSAIKSAPPPESSTADSASAVASQENAAAN